MAGVTMPTRTTIIEQWQKNALSGARSGKRPRPSNLMSVILGFPRSPRVVDVLKRHLPSKCTNKKVCKSKSLKLLDRVGPPGLTIHRETQICAAPSRSRRTPLLANHSQIDQQHLMKKPRHNCRSLFHHSFR